MRIPLFLVASLALSVVGVAPAAAATTAAGTPTPATLTTGATKTFVLSGPTAVADEQVVLTLAGHPDIAGTVSHPGAGPLCIKGLSDSGCGTSITVSVPLTSAYPGVYSIVRTQTPAGGSATTLTTPAGLTVRSQPGITSIAPATRGQDSSSLVTITGTGFGPDPVVSFGSDVTVSDVAYVNGTTITANVTIPATAAPGPRSLTVTSADGLSATSAGALTVAPRPTLTAVSVPTILRGAETDGVTFTGSNLRTGGDFSVVIAGVEVLNPVASSDGTTVTANLKATDTAPGGNRTIALTNADGGRAALTGAFRVIAPPGAPRAVVAIPGDTKATLGWTPPADPGSSPITTWVITPSDSSVPPVEVPGSQTSTLVTGLTNGSSYTFDIQARNDDAGLGAGKSTAAVTPRYAVTLTASSNRPTAVSGQSAVVFGSLKRASGAMSGAPVTLTIAQSGRPPVTRSLTTDANGRWVTTVPLTYTTTFTAAYAGTTDTQARTTPTVTVPVGTRITVTSPRSGATVGSPFTVRGTVSPTKAGRSVGVYKVVSGRSTLVGKGTISASGSFGASVRLPVGNDLLKVVLGPVSGNSTGTSAQFVVKRR